MPGTLFEILQWARENGDITAVDRIRIYVLPQIVTEGFVFSEVGPSTTCSPVLLDAVRSAASEVVGKPCPIQ